MTERENALLVFEHKVPEWVPMVNIACQMLVTPEINDRPLFQDGFDWFGLKWELGNDKGYMTHAAHDQKIVTDISKWREQTAFPSCKDLPWDTMAGRTNAMWPDRDKRLGYIVGNIGAFERINHLMGYENGLMAIYDDAEAYADFVNAYADYRIEQFDYLHKYFKPDFLLMHDDWGSQKDMFISPEMWRKIFKGPEKRMIDHAHSLGMKYVHHSCGKIDQIIGDFVEIGMDGWHAVQSFNDVDYIKREYCDKLVLVGGIDPQVTDVLGVSEEIIRAEVRRAIDTLGINGGHLCSSAVMFSTVPGVEDIINDEGTKYGRRFYK